MTDTIHTCSYFCDRPNCIKAQRDELRDRIAALEAENVELRKDAERYRWLREMPNADSLNVTYVGADLDLVIDAALKEAHD